MTRTGKRLDLYHSSPAQPRLVSVLQPISSTLLVFQWSAIWPVLHLYIACMVATPVQTEQVYSGRESIGIAVSRSSSTLSIKNLLILCVFLIPARCSLVAACSP